MDTTKSRVNSGAPEEWAVPVPLMAPFVLLLNDTSIQSHHKECHAWLSFLLLPDYYDKWIG